MPIFKRLPWRFRPFIRLGVRLALDQMADGTMEGLPELTTEQQDGIAEVRRSYVLTVIEEAEDRFKTTVRAMEAAGEGERPFLDWLFKEGGWKIIYSIVQMILVAFGIVLPPLPPTPPPPPPPPA